MLQRLKQLLVILLLAGFAFQPALAGRFTQEDFEYVFGNSPDISFDFEGIEYLSEQEMEETKGEIAPAVIYAAIVAARVGVQAASKVAARAASRKTVQEAARKAAQAGKAIAQKAQQHLQQAAKFAEKATRAEAKGNIKQAEHFRRKAEEFTAKAAQSTQKAREVAKKGLEGNPFQGKTPQQIDKMLRDKGFDVKGTDPIAGKGSYINPKTGRKYYIDKGGNYKKGTELPHIDVHRPLNSSLSKKKFPLGDRLMK